ncbi:MAG: formate dehydrogenase accessory protein FdhE [Candidatus Caldarchaeum sp.]
MRPTVGERLKRLPAVQAEHSWLSDYLTLYQIVLQAQLRMEVHEGKGADPKILQHSLTKDLQNRALIEGRPLVALLPPLNFDGLSIASCLKEMSKLASGIQTPSPLSNCLNFLLKMNPRKLSEAAEAALKREREKITALASMSETDTNLLEWLLLIPAQPFAEELARNLEAYLTERWFRPPCPVCGRTPLIGKMVDRVRHMLCSFCGAEYLVDLFVCPFCGNRNPLDFSFIHLEEIKGMRLDVCERCKGYVKTIEPALTKPLFPGLEDVLTIGLDLLAEKNGLVRHVDKLNQPKP